MSGADLSPLQRRALGILAPLTPRWTLTGGAALAGFHLHHRVTRDLDLFFRGQRLLGRMGQEAEALLTRAGLEAESLQRELTFCRLRVSDGEETTLVDLVAEPVPSLEDPITVLVFGVELQIDSRHEILVNKLCALLSRSEIRDLVDIDGLLAAGGDLERAVQDAPKKDGGFSGLTLAWLLRQFPMSPSGEHTEQERAAAERARLAILSYIGP